MLNIALTSALASAKRLENRGKEIGDHPVAEALAKLPPEPAQPESRQVIRAKKRAAAKALARIIRAQLKGKRHA